MPIKKDNNRKKTTAKKFSKKTTKKFSSKHKPKPNKNKPEIKIVKNISDGYSEFLNNKKEKVVFKMNKNDFENNIVQANDGYTELKTMSWTSDPEWFETWTPNSKNSDFVTSSTDIPVKDLVQENKLDLFERKYTEAYQKYLKANREMQLAKQALNKVYKEFNINEIKD